MEMRDIGAWAEPLEPNQTPLLTNFPQIFSWAMDDPYQGAIVGYEKAKHPVLGRLVVYPVRGLNRLADRTLAVAGIREAEGWGDDEGDRFVETGGGLRGLSGRIGAIGVRWRHREPIYDEAKVAENRQRIAEKRAQQPPVVWGMNEAMRKEALDRERQIFGTREGGGVVYADEEGE